MTPAFKEWSFIVDALGKGKQNIILRKGGIVEEGNAFELKEKKFVLLPTLFHQAKDHIKPLWLRNLQEESFHREDGKVSIEYYAEVIDQRQLTDWEKVKKLDPFHAWKEEIIRERFERWEKKVHLLIVQVYKLDKPVLIEMNPALAGCKSWVHLEQDIELNGQPVFSKVIF